MIGYHYTSKENALKIQREGFKPLPIYKEEILRYFPQGVKGTWIWTNWLKPEEHLHFIVSQYGTKRTSDIVLFEVQFDKKDLLYHDDMLVEIIHSPIIMDYQLDTQPESVICVKPILPKNIRMIKEYDLIKLLS